MPPVAREVLDGAAGGRGNYVVRVHGLAHVAQGARAEAASLPLVQGRDYVQ